VTRYRRDEQLLEVEKETTYGTEATGAPLVYVPTAVDFSSVHEAMIADPQTTVDGGSRSPVVGTFVDAAPSFSGFAQGLGSALADTQAPTAVAMTHLLGACFQDVPDSLTTSKAKTATVPTTVQVVEDANDKHIVTAYTGKTAVGLCAFEKAGVYTAVRPYIYTSATDTLDLLLALPSAQAVGDLIRGGYCFQWWQKWIGSSPVYSVTVRSLGNDDLQHRKIVGGVAGLAIPAVGPNELPIFDWSLRCSSGSYNFSDTRPSASPARGRVFAGSEVITGSYGATNTYLACARVDINFSTPSLVTECPNIDGGVGGYSRGKEPIEVKLTLPHDVEAGTATDGNFSGSDWVSQWKDYPEEHLQLLVSYGQTVAGHIVAFYFPELVITGVEEGDVNELDSRTITFKPAADSIYPQAVAYIG